VTEALKGRDPFVAYDGKGRIQKHAIIMVTHNNPVPVRHRNVIAEMFAPIIEVCELPNLISGPVHC